MDKGLWIAMTGARHNQHAQTLHANNLANASTTGFRADLAQARAMQVFGDGHPSRVYALTERPATSFAQGVLNATGNDLDVAIKGPGFLVVDGPDGKEALTRDGQLQIDAFGALLTGKGFPVLGDVGPIVLPPVESITIGEDGGITVRPLGTGPDGVVLIDRIRMANPDTADLVKGADGLLHGDGPFLPDADVQLASGTLENSNVNAVSEMVNVLALARQFELQVRMMRSIEENDEAAARIMQSS